MADSYRRRAHRAARAARAVLEGSAAAGVELHSLGSSSPPPGAVARIWPASLPLRYAAHLVVVLIVATITLATGDSSWAGVLQVDAASQAAMMHEALADPRVRRVAPSAMGGNDNDLALPPVRAPQPELLPAFVESHVLAEGETLGAVAERYKVSVASLFWANNLQSGDVLAAGQELRIPRRSGIPHIIQQGETLDSIARMYGVFPTAIVLFKANGVSAHRPLPVGREIFIPDGTLPYPAEFLARYGGEQGIAAMSAVAAGVVQESDTNLRTGPGRGYPRLGYLAAGRRLKLIARYGEWVKVDAGSSGVGWVRADLLGLSEATLAGLEETTDFPPLPARWVWPTAGEITSPFGWRTRPYRSFHDGIDIANGAWTRIVAARRGRVIEAGWCSGFGYCVKIDHGEGISTIYGHLIKRPPVAVGDFVEAGDLIGYMGSTYDRSGGGYSTGVHLHFTVKVNGKAVDPLKFLP